MIDILKRSGLKGDSLSKSTLFVYGLGADEGMVASLRETHQIKGVSYPPLNRIEAGQERIETLQNLWAPWRCTERTDQDQTGSQSSPFRDEKKGEADRETSSHHLNFPCTCPECDLGDGNSGSVIERK